MFARQEAIEQKALAMYQKDPEKAQRFLTDYSNGLMRNVTEMFLELRNEIIVKYTNNHE
jgi:dipeptidase